MLAAAHNDNDKQRNSWPLHTQVTLFQWHKPQLSFRSKAFKNMHERKLINDE